MTLLPTVMNDTVMMSRMKESGDHAAKKQRDFPLRSSSVLPWLLLNAIFLTGWLLLMSPPTGSDNNPNHYQHYSSHRGLVSSTSSYYLHHGSSEAAQEEWVAGIPARSIMHNAAAGPVGTAATAAAAAAAITALPQHVGDKPHPLRTLHVMFGLMGSKESLLDAWEMSLKSVLVNAPTDYDLHVHVLCDEKHACPRIQSRLLGSNGNDGNYGGDGLGLLLGSMWRNRVQLTAHAVSKRRNSKWKRFLQSTLRTDELDERVGLGGYYRLMVHELLKNATKTTSSSTSPQERPDDPWLYMDTDVLVLRNLNDLVHVTQIEEAKSYLFWGSKSWFCSGFIVLYPSRLPEFWDLIERGKARFFNETTDDENDDDEDDTMNESLATESNMTTRNNHTKSKARNPGIGDQELMNWVLQKYPHRVGSLPPAWQRNMGHGWRPRPFRLASDQDGAAMLHFQGGTQRKSSDNYFSKNKDLMEFCDRSKRCQERDRLKEQFRETWGLGSYYLRMPWRWAVQNSGAGNVRPLEQGHPFVFETIDGKGKSSLYAPMKQKPTAIE